MTRQATAIAASALALAIGFSVDGSIGWLLVASGLAAAMACAFASQSLASGVRAPWQLLALGQLLNGLGNMVIAFDSQRWVDSPDWVSAVSFNFATIFTVLGVAGLALKPVASQLVPAGVDLLAITGCALALGLMWNVDEFLGDADGEVDSLLELMGFLAVVVQFAGLAFAPIVWFAQAKGRRTANRLVVLALVAATLGDTEMMIEFFDLSFTVVASMWLLSSLLLLVAATFIGDASPPVRWVSSQLLARLTLAFAIATLASLPFRPMPGGAVGVVIVVVLAAVLISRLLVAAVRSDTEHEVS
ncbi:hypothetical protein [Hoyosella altamirensis]|uniref:hypothetical protein n=1 Tax=Hoyosella altamirensis TaxID=616997 RepID=UPI0007DB3FCF|nr:hypothetical protein [Hoyosella altamirensis]